MSPVELVGHLMEEHSIGRSELARQLGVSRGQVTNMLSGARAISKEMAIKLGERFGLAPSLFLGLD